MSWGADKAIDKHYASFNRRMWAQAIDFLILGFFAPALDAMFGSLLMVDFSPLYSAGALAGDPAALWQTLHESGILAQMLKSLAVQMAVLYLFMGVCWHFWAATPGKLLFKMKIVDADTEAPISSRQIFLRLIGYTLVLIPGVFWISFDRRRQAWHDKVAGTAVIRYTKS